MQLDSLRYFLEVVNAGSITKAANNIYISQQGLSKAVQSLEKECHVTLLKRSSNGKILPTEAGEEFVAAAQSILKTVDSLKVQMASYNEDGSVVEEVDDTTILLTTYLAYIFEFLFDRQGFQNLLSGKVRVFEKSAGKICRTLKESPSHTVALINACPSVVEKKLRPQGFAFEPILRMDMTLKCSPGFIVGKKKSVTIEEVCTLPIALYDEPMLSTLTDELFGKDRLNVVMHTTNRQEITKSVLRGETATFTDTFAESAFGKSPEERLSSNEYVSIPIVGNSEFLAGFLSMENVERSPDCLRYERFCRKYLEMKYDLYIRRHPIAPLPILGQEPTFGFSPKSVFF